MVCSEANPVQSATLDDPFVKRLLRGANSSSSSNRNPENKYRDLIVIAALIEYPGVGLILYETGCAEDLEVVSSSSQDKKGSIFIRLCRRGAPL